MKRALFLIIGLLVLPSFARADDFTLSGYTEAGKRSTAEDYEEEDTDDDYTYRNYHLKFGQKISDRLSYDINSFIYDKDYKSKDSLDNISRLFKTNWSYYIRKLSEESLKLDFKLKYKEKRYDNTPGSEYDQISAAPSFTFSSFLRDPAAPGKKKALYIVDLTVGFDNYDYLETGEKDQLKIFSKIGADGYFLEKKLMLTSSYKIEQQEQKKADRKKTKHEVMGGFDYVFELSLLYKITIRAEWGERDTKDEEERDEDYDYEYWRYYAKTEHRINPRLKTNLKYQYFKKDYVTADLDHRGFYIQNAWDYEVLNDEKQRIWFDFALEHKDVDYTQKSGNDYQKETLKLKASYKRKKNWEVSAALEGNSYDFFLASGVPQNAGNDSSNDKKRYYASLSGEKLFSDGDLVLSLDLKYKYTDYEQKDDAEQEAVRAAFKYKF